MINVKQDISSFSLISFVDLLTGALGAVILLFILTPKQKCAEWVVQGNFPTVELWKDLNKGFVFGEIPDSMKQFAWLKGDTLLVVIADYKKMPVDTVLGMYETPDRGGRYGGAGGGGGSGEKQQPKPPEPVCGISASKSPLRCNDPNTPNDPNDDTYTFDLTVKGANAGKSGWKGKIGKLTISGKYDIPLKVGPLMISEGVQLLEVIDNENGKCVYTDYINPPKECSVPPVPRGHASSSIEGRFVAEIHWKDRKQEVDLIVEKSNVKCWANNKKTNFGKWGPEKGEKIQEYINFNQDPKPGAYDIKVHNYRSKQGPVDVEGSVTIRDATGEVIFFIPFKKRVVFEKFPGTKIGQFIIPDGNGTPRFEPAR